MKPLPGHNKMKGFRTLQAVTGFTGRVLVSAIGVCVVCIAGGLIR
jgi:hypothetical protein